jgi:hypothetical protein
LGVIVTPILGTILGVVKFKAKALTGLFNPKPCCFGIKPEGKTGSGKPVKPHSASRSSVPAVAFTH